MNSKDMGTLNEERVAKYMDAQLTPASGALAGCKSDFIAEWTTPTVRGECKATESKSMSVKLDYLLKINQEAKEHGMEPCLVVSFCNGNGSPKFHGDWAMIPMWRYKEMLLLLNEEEDELAG